MVKLAVPILLATGSLASFAQGGDKANRLAPYVPTPQEIIERMLEVAQVKPLDTVVDIGSGDGRVLVTAVQKFRAKAVGIEIDPKLANQANETLARLGLQNKARVVRADAFSADIREADVVTLYLTTSFNEQLRPKFEKSLKPGTRVVSHDYGIRGWNPVEVEEVFAHGRRHKIFLYVIESKKN
ncbi:MAG: methyltransferase domain-containing protein [Acidobacteria bacterium]|nr:methyltransferase domain-containing protein [Acidobacteriota bacterium]